MAAHAAEVVRALLPTLGAEFAVTDEVAVHRTASIEAGAVVRGPAILGRNCAVAAHAYLRDGVFLDEEVRIGPSCEVKASFLFRGAALAHLNYAGNSLIGSAVNVEAGAVLANHWNERDGKEIAVMLAECPVMTGVEKFGALVGDGVRIGAACPDDWVACRSSRPESPGGTVAAGGATIRTRTQSMATPSTRVSAPSPTSAGRAP